MNIEFLATVAVITPDPINSRNLYVEALGLPLQGEGDGYYHSEQVSIEFDVADASAVEPAAQELERSGYELLHGAREEPWGQTVARLQSPEGAIIGISYAPVLHD